MILAAIKTEEYREFEYGPIFSDSLDYHTYCMFSWNQMYRERIAYKTLFVIKCRQTQMRTCRSQACYYRSLFEKVFKEIQLLEIWNEVDTWPTHYYMKKPKYLVWGSSSSYDSPTGQCVIRKWVFVYHRLPGALQSISIFYGRRHCWNRLEFIHADLKPKIAVSTNRN